MANSMKREALQLIGERFTSCGKRHDHRYDSKFTCQYDGRSAEVCIYDNYAHCS